MADDLVGPDSFPGEDYPSKDSVSIAGSGSTAPPTEDANAPMFKHDGIEYPYLVVNRTGNVGMEISSPVTNKPIGILGATFMWEDVDPFIKHQDLQIRDERNAREDESHRKKANMTTQNSRLFGELVQDGYLIPVEDGERGASQTKTRSEMLALRPEIHSGLINDWLGNFHIERTFPDGEPQLDALLSTPDTIWLKALIGSYKNPTHVLLFEFDVPSPDARRAYESDTFGSASKQEGEKMVQIYAVNYMSKLRFGRKYLRSVQGAIFARDGENNVDTADLVPMTSSVEDINRFRSAFNPNWFMRLADSLSGAFDLAGK